MSKGRYAKLGKPDREIIPEQFQKLLDRSGWMTLQYKAYLALLFWVGCRRSEPLALTRESVTVAGQELLIRDLPAKKGGRRAEVLSLPLELAGVCFVQELAQKTKKGEKLFHFCSRTAYNVVLEVFGVYPHWLRYNRITMIRREINKRNLSLDDAKSFTGIRCDSTMEGYGMTSSEGAARVSKILKNQ